MSIDGIGELLRNARVSRGLSEEQCALSSGLDPLAYHHLEMPEDDEFFAGICLGEARRLCWLLGLDLLDVTARCRSADINAREGMSLEDFYARSRFIARLQTASGLSDEALGDKVGVHSWAISSITRSADAIESWSLDQVIWLSEALEIDAGLLIGNPDRSRISA